LSHRSYRYLNLLHFVSPGVGGTLTWYANNGFYLDGQAQVTWFDSDLSSSTAGLLLADGNDGVGYALSLGML